MALTFQERLKAVIENGNLRAADLARWFDRRHSTVSGWLDGREPAGPPGDVRGIFVTLIELEAVIIARKLPIPRMPAERRLAHIEKLKRSALRKRK